MPLPLHAPSSGTRHPLLLRNGAPRISWFHRSLIFGGAGVAVIAVIFLSALIIAVSDPTEATSAGADESDRISDAPIANIVAATEEPAVADTEKSPVTAAVSAKLRTVRRPARIQRDLAQVRRVAHIPRRFPRPAQAPAFVPTTLIIYPENGEIKTRIEPTLSAVYRPSTL
jgi:hypothetical protein